MTYIHPLLTVFLAVCLVGWVRFTGRNRKAILAVGLLGLFLLSWPPAEWLFSRPLESPYSLGPFRTQTPPQAIVVLGGGPTPARYDQPYPVADLDTVQHCAMASWLHKQMQQLPVLGCAGARANSPSVMRDLLRGGGVPDDLIWLESRSQNTHENAVYGAAILKEHGIRQIALVTDAQSMRRAAACFRKQGITVIPAPCEFEELEFSADDLLPNWKAIRLNEHAFHEALGLAWYSLRGWI